MTDYPSGRPHQGSCYCVTFDFAMATIAGVKSREGADPKTSILAAVATAGYVSHNWIFMNAVNRNLHSLSAVTDSEAIEARRLVVTWN